MREVFFSAFRQFERDLPFGQSLPQVLKLNLDDLFEVVSVQTVEHYDFIDPIQKFRSEFVPQGIQHISLHTLIRLGIITAPIAQDQLAADVRGHDDNGVLKVNRSSMTVGQPPIVQNLE